MLRFISSAFVVGVVLAALPAAGGILPDRLDRVMKSGVKEAPAPDPTLFEEYGFETGETATFGPTTLTAWRFRDSTGAMAAYQYARPADAKPAVSTINGLASRTSKGAIYEYGNYVIQVSGKVPKDEDLAPVYLALAKVEKAPLPVISTYLPPAGLIPNSERYITGPVSLQKFDSLIPPGVAAFHLSAEAQLGRYPAKDGALSLAIFYYPTPGIARERLADFSKLPGVVAKRTGPLVAAVTGTSDSDAAERVLAKVNYQASVTVNEQKPNREVRTFAQTIINYIVFAGIIILFCAFSGLLFAGIRILSRRLAPRGADEAMITLHLDAK